MTRRRYNKEVGRRARGALWAGAWTALSACAEPSSYTPLPPAPSDAASVLFAVDEPSFAMFAAELGGPLWIPSTAMHRPRST